MEFDKSSWWKRAVALAARSAVNDQRFRVVGEQFRTAKASGDETALEAARQAFKSAKAESKAIGQEVVKFRDEFRAATQYDKDGRKRTIPAAYDFLLEVEGRAIANQYNYPLEKGGEKYNLASKLAWLLFAWKKHIFAFLRLRDDLELDYTKISTETMQSLVSKGKKHLLTLEADEPTIADLASGEEEIDLRAREMAEWIREDVEILERELGRIEERAKERERQKHQVKPGEHAQVPPADQADIEEQIQASRQPDPEEDELDRLHKQLTSIETEEAQAVRVKQYAVAQAKAAEAEELRKQITEIERTRAEKVAAEQVETAVAQAAVQVVATEAQPVLTVPIGESVGAEMVSLLGDLTALKADEIETVTEAPAPAGRELTDKEIPDFLLDLAESTDDAEVADALLTLSEAARAAVSRGFAQKQVHLALQEAQADGITAEAILNRASTIQKIVSARTATA